VIIKSQYSGYIALAEKSKTLAPSLCEDIDLLLTKFIRGHSAIAYPVDRDPRRSKQMRVEFQASIFKILLDSGVPYLTVFEELEPLLQETAWWYATYDYRKELRHLLNSLQGGIAFRSSRPSSFVEELVIRSLIDERFVYRNYKALNDFMIRNEGYARLDFGLFCEELGAFAYEENLDSYGRPHGYSYDTEIKIRKLYFRDEQDYVLFKIKTGL